MKLNTKIWIDRIVGAPLLWGIKARQRLIFKKQTMQPALVEHIVIAKYKGMGSIIQATPLIQTIVKNHPKVRITFLTEQGNEALIGILAPLIHDSILIDDSNLINLYRSLRSGIRRIRAMNHCVFIDLEVYSNLGKIVSLQTRAQWKYGLSNKKETSSSGDFIQTIPFDSHIPIKDMYLRFAEFLHGASRVEALYKPVVESSRYAALKNKKFIILNPNASELRIERRWEISKFAKLANHLCQQLEPDTTLVLIGAPNEQDYVQQLVKGMEPQWIGKVLNLTGLTSILELFFVIDQCRLMISVDSGPMNFSLALQKPTIALFGPVNPVQYGAMEHCITVYKNVDCSPCVHNSIHPPCKGNNQCMQQIGEEEVLNEALRIMNVAR